MTYMLLLMTLVSYLVILAVHAEHPLYSCTGCFHWCSTKFTRTQAESERQCLSCNSKGTLFYVTPKPLLHCKDNHGCYGSIAPGTGARATRVCRCDHEGSETGNSPRVVWQYWQHRAGAANVGPEAAEDVEGPAPLIGSCQYARSTNPDVASCHSTTTPAASSERRSPNVVCANGGCISDFADHNGVTNIVELAELLSSWGPAPNCADLNNDGKVDILDLAHLLAVWGPCPPPFVCAPGYTCSQISSDIVWVMRNDGNIGTYSCNQVCQIGLAESPGVFYVCDPAVSTFSGISRFSPIAASLGFSCLPGECWGSEAPGQGLQLVSIDGTDTKTCYYPSEAKFSCDNNPGNANCFGERYASVCPCTVKPLAEACRWSCPNYPLTPDFPLGEGNAGDCLSRINYWRRRACEENWFECPPSGLPPYTECTGCNSCANSQALYDRTHTAHASFGRCGEFVQGVGEGPNCAAVIDGFVASRKADSQGVMKCEGHCAPILEHGCQTFHFGHSDGTESPSGTAGTYVLNWGNCDAATCQSYCSAPFSNGCFSTPASPDPSTYHCVA